MLEKVLRLYICAMAGEVRSPMPHLFGPPGAGKSTVVEQAAKLMNVQLRTVNLARVSPLEIEGIQMPDLKNKKVEPLMAAYWSGLRDGDIVLLDEFLRAFPETYNAMLDIMTSRRVGHHTIPNVFIIGASNSTVAYDAALEDRLLHIPVPDIRTDKKARAEVRKRFVEELGLMPAVANTQEMEALLISAVDPTYAILDNLGKGAAMVARGKSLRHLKGEAQLREFRTPSLMALLELNNILAIQQGSLQHVLLMSGENVPSVYDDRVRGLLDNPHVGEVQKRNIRINFQLIDTVRARTVDYTLKEDEDAALAFS